MHPPLQNTSGGVIAFGIETARDANGNDTGVPVALPGLSVNLDTEKTRLSQLLRDGLEPSLTAGVAFQSLTIAGAGGPVLLLGVSPSLLGPHRVVAQGSNRFWRRGPTGKYEPDVEELRRMFLEWRSWKAEADVFRDQRVMALHNKLAIPMADTTGQYFVHVLPLGRLGRLLDLPPHREKLIMLMTFGNLGGNASYNADGFLFAEQGNSPQSREITHYSQWFRFGGVEGYENPTRTINGNRTIYVHHMSDETVRYVRVALQLMRSVFELDPPFGVCLTLNNIRGVAGKAHSGMWSATVIDRQRVDVPLVIFETHPDSSDDMVRVLRPALDVLWQTMGYQSAPLDIGRGVE